MPGKSAIQTELPAEVVRHLSGGGACVVATVDPDGRPSTTLMTWAVARDPRHVALCVDTRSGAFLNLVERGGIALEVLGDGLVWGAKGVATIEKPAMTATPFPCALVAVTVDEVRDHAAPGVRFRGPSYVYDEDKQHRHELERRIFDELRAG